MSSLENQRFVCIDCEATGLDPQNDHVIEVAAVVFTFKDVLAEYESLVDPECPIPEKSIAIHHITQDMVVGKPKIADVLHPLMDLVGDALIIGHGIEYDLKILANEAQRVGIATNFLSRPFIDTLRMARLYGESPVNSLERLRAHFNIAAEGAHRALNDAKVNMEVFKQLARRYKSVKQILEILAKPIQMKLMPLGKHKGRLLKDIPIEYLQWAVNKDFDQDLLYSLKLEIKRRRKGGHFSQAANPFGSL
ncbi:MAG: DUF3820 family protein [Parachlamydiales bacterium]|nr:DUF3820 family protein [Parachlamydiales bacterium]